MTLGKETTRASWVTRRVGELATAIQYGYTAKATAALSGPKYLRITDIQDDAVEWSQVPSCSIDDDDVQKYRLQPGDLLFARTGATVGKSYLIRPGVPESVFASYLIRIRLKDEADPRYVAYFFQSPSYWRQINENQVGIGQPNVNGKKLAQVQLPVAPIGEQNRIVAEIETQFSRLDEAVAGLRRVKANLKRYKAAVLKSAVTGRLVPTEADLARRERRSYETGAELLQRILETRRSQWQGKGKYKEPTPPNTTDLPELPEGWVWTHAGTLCDCIVPNRDKPKSFTGATPWLTLPDFDEHTIEVSQSRSALGLSAGEIAEFRAKVVPRSSVVMSCVGRFGVSAVLACPAVINQQLHAFLPSNGVVPRYLAYALRTRTKEMYEAATATTIAYLNKDNCNSVRIPLPSVSEQHRIVAEVDRRLSIAREAEAELDANLKRAQGLRQAILSKAFSGGVQ